MESKRPVLYTKTGCPWCDEARAVLDRRGIRCDERVVTTSPTAAAEMRRVSGQTKAPVLDWSGEVLADFGAAELEPFLAARAVKKQATLHCRRIRLPSADAQRACPREVPLPAPACGESRRLAAVG